MDLVEVTIELDLNPKEAEEINQDYLKLKGLDEIIRVLCNEKVYSNLYRVFLYLPR
jgi:hypothetical protein